MRDPERVAQVITAAHAELKIQDKNSTVGVPECEENGELQGCGEGNDDRKDKALVTFSSEMLTNSQQTLELEPMQRTPVKHENLKIMLKKSGYDQDKSNRLVDGFARGFSIGMDKTVKEIMDEQKKTEKKQRKNQKSVSSHPEIIMEKFIKEISAHRMVGPFLNPPFNHYLVFPLGLRRKKEPNKYRVIHDLSAEVNGISVNSTIPDFRATTSYDTIYSAIKLIQRLGPGCVLCKTDIEHAYKLLPVRPEEIPALGIKWGKYYMWDATLPMGCRSGAQLFEEFSTALQHIAEHEGCGPMCHVLDDFLLVATAEEADTKFEKFLQICKELGIPVVVKKTEKGTCLIFLGIELDTIAMQARLPADKLQKCLRLLNRYISQVKITVEQLESLTGLLNFACSVVEMGRPFLRRLYQLLWGVKRQPFYRIRIKDGARRDMIMWKAFLENYNGISLFLPPEPLKATDLQLQWYAGEQGCGIVIGRHWITLQWPVQWRDYDKDIKEAYTILVMLVGFSKQLANKRVLLPCRNAKVTIAINEQTEDGPEFMVILRDIVLTQLTHNIHVRLEFDESPEKHLAMLLSLNQVAQFKEKQPEAELSQQEVPEKYLPSKYDITLEAY